MLSRHPNEFDHWVSLTFPRLLEGEAMRIQASIKSKAAEHRGRLPELKDAVFLETYIDRLTPLQLEEQIATKAIVIVSLLHTQYWASPNCLDEWHKLRATWPSIHDRVYMIRYDDSGPRQERDTRYGYNLANKPAKPGDDKLRLNDSELKLVSDSIFDILLTQIDSWQPAYRNLLPLVNLPESEIAPWELLTGTHLRVERLADARNTLDDFAGPAFVLLDCRSSLGFADSHVLRHLCSDQATGRVVIVICAGQEKRQTERLIEGLQNHLRAGRICIVNLEGNFDSDRAAVVRDYMADAAEPLCNVFFAGPERSISETRRRLGLRGLRIHWYDISSRQPEASVATLLVAARQTSIRLNLFVLNDEYLSQLHTNQILRMLPGLIGRCKATSNTAACSWRSLRDHRDLLTEYWCKTELLGGSFDTERLCELLEAYCLPLDTPPIVEGCFGR